MNPPNSLQKLLTRDILIRVGSFLFVVFLAALATFVIMYTNTKRAIVVSSAPAGHLVTANYWTDFYGAHTKVESDLGIFLVDGAFVGMKGHDLVLETRYNRERYLCFADRSNCRLVTH